MSPRIQVYKAIACRSLSSDPPGLGLAALINGGQCSGADASDVQARAAKIQAAVVTTMSTLSAITTGFWSRAGDRQGRKNILIVFLVGALLMWVNYNVHPLLWGSHLSQGGRLRARHEVGHPFWTTRRKPHFGGSDS